MDPPWLPGEIARRERANDEGMCPECARRKFRHWPYCSEASIEAQVRFAESEKWRSMRTARRVGE